MGFERVGFLPVWRQPGPPPEMLEKGAALFDVVVARSCIVFDRSISAKRCSAGVSLMLMDMGCWIEVWLHDCERGERTGSM